MPVVKQANFNAASLVVDDVYVVVAPPGNATIQGVNTGIAGYVGSAAWGPINMPQLCGTPQDMGRTFGPLGLGAWDMATDMVVGFQQGVTAAVGVRITDGTEVASTGDLNDTGTQATGTVTIGGTAHTGDVVTVTVDGTAVPYTVTANDDTLVKIAAKVATAIAGNATVAAKVTATVLNAVVTLTAVAPGVDGNSITLASAVSGQGSAVTATRSAATLANAIAPKGILTFPAKYTGKEGDNITVSMAPGKKSGTFTLTIARGGKFPDSEEFPNLPADGFVNAAITAVRDGLSPARGASDLCDTPVVVGGGYGGTDTVAIVGGTSSVSLSGGDNGDAFGNGDATAFALGDNTAIPATGMYALEGTGTQQFMLCGSASTDSTGWSLQISFGEAIGAIAALAFPANTSSAAAVAAKAAAGLDSQYFTIDKDWIKFFDSSNKAMRDISPAAFVLGLMASQSPEQSPGNKPMNGINGTERSLKKQPYSPAELRILESNGIGVITNPCPGGKYFGRWHGLNGSSDPDTNDIPWTRMTNFLAYSFNGWGGKFVGKLQSNHPDDPERTKALKGLTSFLEQLKQAKKIDDYTIDMSDKINTTESIGRGFMKAVVRVKYMSVIRFFTITLIGGRTVDVKVSAAA